MRSFRPPLHAGLTIGIALLSAGGCEDGEASPAHVVRDSADVTIVENAAPSWSPGAGWVVDAAPVLDIGGGDAEDQQLFEVRDVSMLSSGEVLVAERTRLRIYNQQGTLQRQLGREGRGPGEFSQVGAAFECGGRLWVGELFDTRVTLFDAAANPVVHNAYPPAAAMSQSLSGCLNHRPAGVFHERTPPPQPPQIRRESSVLAWIDGDAPDTILGIRQREVMGGLVRPFARTGLHAVAGSIIVTADNGVPEFLIRAANGDVERIVRIALPSVPVTGDDRDRITEQYTAGVPATILAEIQPLMDAMPFHETMPYFSAVHVLADGTLWVQAYSPFRDVTPTRWTVIDNEGRWLGDVEMPDGLSVHAIGPDWVLGIARDANDVEHVRLHRIVTASDRTGG